MCDAKVPCKSCPWRKDSKSEVIPNLDVERAEVLVGECVEGSIRPTRVFACHMSEDGGEFGCAGFLQSDDARHHLVLRLLSIRDRRSRVLEPREDCFANALQMARHHKWRYTPSAEAQRLVKESRALYEEQLSKSGDEENLLEKRARRYLSFGDRRYVVHVLCGKRFSKSNV